MLREDVIRQIVERERAGQGLAEETVQQEKPDLYLAASTLFGTWETALQYAGVNLRRLWARHGYTSEHVLRRIQCLCRDGYSLKAADCQRRDRRLWEAARRYFGGWRKALEAAGVNLQKAGLNGGRPRRLTREKIMEELRAWLAAGHSRSWLEICLTNHELALAVKHVCGSWHRAMMAVGLVPEKRPDAKKRKWSAERVLECLRLRHQEGKPMHYTPMHTDDNPLLCAAKKYFGNLGNALVAAGIKPEQRKPGRPVKKDGRA